MTADSKTAGPSPGAPDSLESQLREQLRTNAGDASALHRLARISIEKGERGEAEMLLARALSIVPEFTAARRDYAAVLDHQMKWQELGAQLEILLAREPGNPEYRITRASALVMLGEFERAISEYEHVLKEQPQNALLWTRYGHALRAAGKYDACVAAYRRSITLRPAFGIGWRNLANLKTFRFTSAEVEAMKNLLGNNGLPRAECSRLHFALGKALEDDGDFDGAFAHFSEGNAIRDAYSHHDPQEISTYVQRCKVLYTREFFLARAGSGCAARDPIFILGMPRSGSTLLEQILSSHSSVEGTAELADIPQIADGLDLPDIEYPESLDRMGAAQLGDLGARYLERTRIQRKLGRPFFVDKMPDNFLHIGLIHLILPNAKIIDARRHPLACGISLFKQDFARGMDYTYNLDHIGQYYQDYADLMAHFDVVLPSRILPVRYEDVVCNSEHEIRRLLDYCELPFEDTCLRFHENSRGVRTSSSEQVRRPIYSGSLDSWRHYEARLERLRAALGPVLERCADTTA